jgi:hypothetical protein
MHIKVAHFLNHDTHFLQSAFSLETYLMNNKTYQIENLKFIIH